MTDRFTAGPEDWPIGNGKWWAVFDRTTMKMLVHIRSDGYRSWRLGKKAAETLAAQLNRGSRTVRVESGIIVRGKAA